MISIKSNKNIKTPWIIGHRGYHAKYPENTLVSFEAAIYLHLYYLFLCFIDTIMFWGYQIVLIHISLK